MILTIFSNVNDSMIPHLGQEGSSTHSLNTGQRRNPMAGTYQKRRFLSLILESQSILQNFRKYNVIVNVMFS